jgi:MFS family permease
MRILTKPIRILLISDGLVMIAASMLVPFYALFVEKLGGDVLVVGVGASLFAVAAGISVIIAGGLADRVRRMDRMIAWSYLVMAAGFALYIFVDTIWLLLVAQVIIGLSQASYEPSFDALYGEHARAGGEHSAKRWSFSAASDYFAAAIGAGLGAVIVHYLGFTALFAVMTGLSLLGSIYLFLQPAGVFSAESSR